MRVQQAAAVALVAAASLLAVQAQAHAYTERFAAQCGAGHGTQGVSAQALTPSLAGQPSCYAITQLFLFRDGWRGSGPMTAIAKTMDDDDRRGFADVIGKLPPAPPAVTRPPDARRLARGADLAQRLHCPGCHGSQGEGGRQVPRLAGQREDHLLLAPRSSRAGTRVGCRPARTEAMAGVAPDQIDDLTHALARLPHGPAAPRP
jgi:cytochrome c553